MIEIFHHKIKVAKLDFDKKFFLEYKNFDFNHSISLSLPNSQKFYINDNIFPFFDMYIPEGYLFEIFKNYLIKEFGFINDFLLFKFLSSNIEARITYKSEFKKDELKFFDLDLDYVLENDTPDTFQNILNTFFKKNSISGIQPKSIAILKDKEKLIIKDYIVKTWGNEFPYLSENEFWCLKAVQNANIEIPEIHLSKNKKFLVVKRFDDEFTGFEEVISLFGKNRIFKYNGSYEQISKVIYQFVNEPEIELKKFYKLIVMNYLLKNGDAHLKNFGLIYNNDFSEIRLAPAYDIVTTTAYFYKDKPALTLNGRKIWYGKRSLIDFGIKYCLLNKKDAEKLYEECMEALKKTIIELENYISKNIHFETIGRRMLYSWKLSFENKDFKELPFGNI